MDEMRSFFFQPFHVRFSFSEKISCSFHFLPPFLNSDLAFVRLFCFSSQEIIHLQFLFNIDNEKEKMQSLDFVTGHKLQSDYSLTGVDPLFYVNGNQDEV
jgi:hypothetical protein